VLFVRQPRPARTAWENEAKADSAWRSMAAGGLGLGLGNGKGSENGKSVAAFGSAI